MKANRSEQIPRAFSSCSTMARSGHDPFLSSMSFHFGWAFLSSSSNNRLKASSWCLARARSSGWPLGSPADRLRPAARCGVDEVPELGEHAPKPLGVGVEDQFDQLVGLNVAFAC